ncbi:UDP-N-acetylmuramate--L-alanine ligase [Hymenobacter sp. ASUV-10]|uniref:UDP-N-acetylmuramate--L-alanine ligase n=1 Tax=Hymenobacter aranciens TaxID=3063996 RepID=A0ABT9BEI3_9BACT|nr:UDP-N-acetylmuramate--L-alanine ligase [Hymenobacter sp. ASUV-10]MDO7876675.1 UDP-N-acetylmuramate--L-alanine ligase [Hymenobacter sp. ASUV-10]
MNQFPYVFFLGIGGIGMSALARWFQANGHQVSGYDKTETPLTLALQAEGIAVHYADAVENIPTAVRENRSQTLVVLTPAIPAESLEWAWLREQGYDIRKRSQVLGVLTQGRYTIAVAGTHGKTTTSSMVAHLLHHAGLDCGAFLGGIAVNLGSNLLLPATPEAPIVVEADEYDRSFLTLHPDIAIVTSTDADHLDIYGDQSALVESFRQFVAQIKPGGTLLLNHTAHPSVAAAVPVGTRVIRYGLSPDQGPELYAANISAEGHRFHFDLHGPQGIVADLQLAVPGYHNVENMLAAAAVAQLQGVAPEKLSAAVAAYRGVKRRFEFIVTADDKVYLDDYAHHPREIEAFLRSVRKLYPNKRLRVVFQPHLFTRTRDFAAGFSESLSIADEVILLDIYPAREKPLPGVTSDMLLADITAPHKSIQTKEQVLAGAQNDDFDVLATVGAGDIDTLVPQLKQLLTARWS